MKYRCAHCSHVFELEDRDFRRCPNCFWTTSIVALEQESAGGGETVVPRAPVVQPESEKAHTRSRFGPRLVIPLFAIGILGAFSFVLLRLGVPVPQFSSVAELIPKKQVKPFIPSMTAAKSKVMPPAESFLAEQEIKELMEPLQVTIPRQLSADEEEILKKQVSVPSQLAEKPTLRIWSKEDFEKLIQSEQDQTKIKLGWSYVRSLVKTFESAYPAAFEALDKGDYVLAREFFLTSLSFRVYRNNPVRHRAIALVMLRPFVNDVIGKIATLNQYLLSQSLTQEARAVFESYQGIFPVLELQEWDRALQLIEELREKMRTFEERPQAAEVAYPPVFGTLDPEIQAAIRSEAVPKPEAALNLKPLTIDLGLKETIVRQNTTESLLEAQKRSEDVSRLLAAKNWSQAHETLRSMEYPPELADEARKKMALIDKMLALQEAGAKQK